MYIGEVSKKTSLSIKAIRFYEAKGLINPPKRSGRYRVYHAADVDLLMLIKQAKQLGVSLSQLKGVIVYQDGKLDWLRIKLFLAELRVQLQTKIADLTANIANIDECCRQIDTEHNLKD
jgi:MerR family transcriptional regulator, copper efflux regulator